MEFLDAYLDVSQNKAEDFDAARASISTLSGTTALTFLKKCSVAIDSLAGVRRGNCIQLQSRLFLRIQDDPQLTTLLGTYLLMDEFDTHCQSRLVALAVRNLRLMTNNFEKVCVLSETVKRLLQGAKSHESLFEFLNTIVDNHWCPEMAEHAPEMCKLLRLYDRAFRVVETVTDNLTPAQIVQFDVVGQIAENYSDDSSTAKFFELVEAIDGDLVDFPNFVPRSLVAIAGVLLLSKKRDALGRVQTGEYEEGCEKLCLRLTDWNVAFALRHFIVANQPLLPLYQHTLHILAPLEAEHRFLESAWMLLFEWSEFAHELKVALCDHAESISKRYTSVADLAQRASFLDDLTAATAGQMFPSAASVVHRCFARLNYIAITATTDKTDGPNLLAAASATLEHAVFHSQSSWVVNLITVLSTNLNLLPPEAAPLLLTTIRRAVAKVSKMKDPKVLAVVPPFLEQLGPL